MEHKKTSYTDPMEQSRTPYIVITRNTLKGLLGLAKSNSNRVVCLDLEFSGKEWPGQMRFTNETDDRVWEQIKEIEEGRD